MKKSCYDHNLWSSRPKWTTSIFKLASIYTTGLKPTHTPSRPKLDVSRELMSTILNTAVVLPSLERCCPVTGGALAKWTLEVYGYLGYRLATTVYASGFEKTNHPYKTKQVLPPRIATLAAGYLRNRELKGLLRRPKLFFRQAYYRAIASRMLHQPPQVIHIHNDPFAVVPLRSKFPKSRIILHMNNDHLVEGDAKGETARTAVENSDQVVFCSNYILQNAANEIPELSEKNTRIFKNGATCVPENEIDFTCKSWKADYPTLLFAGRIVPEKGLHILLEAFAYIKEAFPSAKLKVVGGINFGSHASSIYLDSMKALAEGFGSSIEFTGPLSHSATMDSFKRCDAFVCPSIWNEPLGMVNVEAMASGVPVIAFSKGGIPETVDSCGLLINRCDAHSLAEGVIYLLRNADYRLDMARRGYKRVEQLYQWKVIAEDWIVNLQSL